MWIHSIPFISIYRNIISKSMNHMMILILSMVVILSISIIQGNSFVTPVQILASNTNATGVTSERVKVSVVPGVSTLDDKS